MHEIDGTRWGGTGVRLDRIVVADGIDVWFLHHRGTEGWRRGAVADRLEVGASLSGEWVQEGRRSGPRRYAAGRLHGLSPAEPYQVAYRSDGALSVVVGLTADARALLDRGEADRDLRIADPKGDRDPALLDLLAELHRRRLAQEPLPLSDIVTELRRFVERRCELSERSPLARARWELEEAPERELYLAHLAADAGMDATLFLRRFARRYGVTPVHYRGRVRLNAAARAAWADPTLTVERIAEAYGFHSLSYFHRAFRTYYGTTPDRHRRNGLL